MHSTTDPLRADFVVVVVVETKLCPLSNFSL